MSRHTKPTKPTKPTRTARTSQARTTAARRPASTPSREQAIAAITAWCAQEIVGVPRPLALRVSRRLSTVLAGAVTTANDQVLVQAWSAAGQAPLRPSPTCSLPTWIATEVRTYLEAHRRRQPSRRPEPVRATSTTQLARMLVRTLNHR